MQKMFFKPNEKSSFNGFKTKITKLVLSKEQTFFKMIVNVFITLAICKSQISGSLFAFKRIRHRQNDSDRAFFDTSLYWFLTLITWINIAIAFRII